VDEKQFKSHSEKVFWEQFILMALRSGVYETTWAVQQADMAIEARRLRMVKIAPKAKAA
jgi:hypothetical protein